MRVDAITAKRRVVLKERSGRKKLGEFCKEVRSRTLLSHFYLF